MMEKDIRDKQYIRRAQNVYEKPETNNIGLPPRVVRSDTPGRVVRDHQGAWVLAYVYVKDDWFDDES